MLKSLLRDIGITAQKILDELNFECLKCGECCLVDKSKVYMVDIIFRVLWTGETDNLPTEGWVKLPLKNKCFEGKLKLVRKKGGFTCFFHDIENDQCSVYEHRPLMCRAHPIMIMPTGKVGWNDKCKGAIKANITINDLMNTPSNKEFVLLIFRLSKLLKEQENIGFRLIKT